MIYKNIKKEICFLDSIYLYENSENKIVNNIPTTNIKNGFSV